MATKIVVVRYPEFDRTNVVKNGKIIADSQQFLCKDCRKSAVMYPLNQRSQAEKDQILAGYQECPRMRGIALTFHVSRNTCTGQGLVVHFLNHTDTETLRKTRAKTP